MAGDAKKRVAIIAAMPGELLHLARGWKHERREGGVHLWRKSEGDSEWVAACAGAGQAAATRAFAEVENEGRVDSVICTGWVGALTPEFLPGRVYEVAGVIDAKTGERFQAEALPVPVKAPVKQVAPWRAPGRNGAKGAPPPPPAPAEAEMPQPKPWLVTNSRVASAEEKRRLAESYPAGLVDMEAAAMARLAAMRQIPFCCIKGVSDGHSAHLPDFNRFLTPEGQFRLGGFLVFAFFRPWYWSALMRMSENSSKASQALRDSLLENLRRPGAH